MITLCKSVCEYLRMHAHAHTCAGCILWGPKGPQGGILPWGGYPLGCTKCVHTLRMRVYRKVLAPLVHTPPLHPEGCQEESTGSLDLTGSMVWWSDPQIDDLGVWTDSGVCHEMCHLGVYHHTLESRGIHRWHHLGMHRMLPGDVDPCTCAVCTRMVRPPRTPFGVFWTCVLHRSTRGYHPQTLPWGRITPFGGGTPPERGTDPLWVRSPEQLKTRF